MKFDKLKTRFKNKKVEISLKILGLFLSFGFFIIYPLITLQNFKTKLYELSDENQEISEKKIITQKKISSLEKEIELKIKSTQEIKSKFIQSSFSSSSEFKLFLKNKMKKHNLETLGIYRTEYKNVEFDGLKNKKAYEISIPYHIKGSLINFFTFTKESESFYKTILFNKHPISISLDSPGILSIKFKATAFTVSETDNFNQ